MGRNLGYDLIIGIMKDIRRFLPVVGIVLLLGLALISGEVIGASLRSKAEAAAAGTSSANGSVLASGDFYSQEFASSTDMVTVSGLAVGGLGDALLKSSVWNALLDYERRQNCSDVTSRAIRVAQINEADSFWIEEWTVAACGKTRVFKVKFRPDQVGGTLYEISHP